MVTRPASLYVNKNKHNMLYAHFNDDGSNSGHNTVQLLIAI